ncbi:MAG: sigma-70 family RNA polymerase sigma factor, partial [Planctomycetes bacterium]|nr:sigma-70 family RNA polymerase sigma factor [Planctomycetota bacterium]
MDSTSVSLLRRLRQPNQDAAWQRFVDLYAPLIFHWAKTHGLNATDSADLVQEVMATLVVKLPQFQYDPKRRFRGWLRTVTVNKARDFQRREAARPVIDNNESIQNLAVPDAVDLFDEAEYRRFLVRRCLELMRTEFQDKSWQACWKHIIEDRRAADVAE